MQINLHFYLFQLNQAEGLSFLLKKDLGLPPGICKKSRISVLVQVFGAIPDAVGIDDAWMIGVLHQ